ncbi:nucleotide sugar dehydrogenase [Candidatus Falkowbacteria bacterium CG10_big_fil_rev_8_21_14_0_10_44_15]|uniref:Nucleotide sugar dehydrogenase n=1 Tax=Candidatus Falkowbacteria bacterium CG10_big_fil_rev_8_21_14_0_10_44_15 TaxID=1974569 RepID=A0A2H0V0C3_9BACT|nr:MAG: nucleotide sugar dehydrogenase [Candidatus Falkowbacteria bacterium CG10_big_fil_rev_8_21_14_0_10_44_15]
MLEDSTICIIGGAGHIGLPLGVSFANQNIPVTLLDINEQNLSKIKNGIFPFKEDNGEQELQNALQKNTLTTSMNPDVISQSDIVIMIIGTPIDEYLNPDFKGILKTIDKYFDYFKDGQTLILRSTIFPGTSEKVQNYFTKKGKLIKVAFCPERIVQGKAFVEFRNTPQIVSAFNEETLIIVKNLFQKITERKVIVTKPMEAELAKLFCNAWRYVSFAVANQFFMIAHEHDVDYQKVFKSMTDDYPRMQDLPSPGFAAGPCLHKDTMQLSAFAHNNFFLGHSAMLINEGLPNFLIKKLKQKHDLKNKKIGILGMAFKANNDDKRDSLAYKLKKIAQIECEEVLCHDVYIADPRFHKLETLLQHSDIIILAAPHAEYKAVDPKQYPNKVFIDIWGFWK